MQNCRQAGQTLLEHLLQTSLAEWSCKYLICIFYMLVLPPLEQRKTWCPPPTFCYHPWQRARHDTQPLRLASTPSIARATLTSPTASLVPTKVIARLVRIAGSLQNGSHILLSPRSPRSYLIAIPVLIQSTRHWAGPGVPRNRNGRTAMKRE